MCGTGSTQPGMRHLKGLENFLFPPPPPPPFWAGGVDGWAAGGCARVCFGPVLAALDFFWTGGNNWLLGGPAAGFEPLCAFPVAEEVDLRARCRSAQYLTSVMRERKNWSMQSNSLPQESPFVLTKSLNIFISEFGILS